MPTIETTKNSRKDERINNLEKKERIKQAVHLIKFVVSSDLDPLFGLTKHQKELLQMYFIENKPYTTIAHRLTITKQAVKHQIDTIVNNVYTKVSKAITDYNFFLKERRLVHAERDRLEHFKLEVKKQFTDLFAEKVIIEPGVYKLNAEIIKVESISELKRKRITELPISARLKNVLSGNGIHTVNELLSMEENDMKRMRNVGVTTLKEFSKIKNTLDDTLLILSHSRNHMS